MTSHHTKIVAGKLVHSPGGNEGSGPAMKAEKKEEKESTSKFSCKSFQEELLM